MKNEKSKLNLLLPVRYIGLGMALIVGIHMAHETNNLKTKNNLIKLISMSDGLEGISKEDAITFSKYSGIDQKTVLEDYENNKNITLSKYSKENREKARIRYLLNR